MKEIKLRIMGGLGNQLYQYAAARYIQDMVGADSILIDIVGYEKYKIRKLELNSILRNDAVKFDKLLDKKYVAIREMFHIYQRLHHTGLKRHAPMSRINIGGTSYLLSSIEFNDKILNNLQDDVYLYGYFVSAKIAQYMRKQLMREIVEPDNLSDNYKSILSKIQNTNAVGVSIRCGDDYKDNGWPVCAKEFYISGMKKIRIAHPDTRFFIFSDDMDRVKEEKWFNEFPVQFVENVSVCESFEILRNCKYYVCSNSSFSWWGAFLSYNDKAVIYSPNYIFSDSRENDKVLLPNMIILDYHTGELVNAI